MSAGIAQAAREFVVAAGVQETAADGLTEAGARADRAAAEALAAARSIGAQLPVEDLKKLCADARRSVAALREKR